jgi:hypothetical protein
MRHGRRIRRIGGGFEPELGPHPRWVECRLSVLERTLVHAFEIADEIFDTRLKVAALRRLPWSPPIERGHGLVHPSVVISSVVVRQETRSIIMTSQLDPKHWHDYLSDPTLADAICDRILSRAPRVVLKGPSRRNPEKIEK